MIIIGGLPKPIGGVTSFLQRLVLLYNQEIDLFIDLYPHRDKEVPISIVDKYFCLEKYKLPKIFYQKTNKSSVVFFNFSRLHSIIITIFLRKSEQNWHLMLHHGDIELSFNNFILSFILRRFDYIYCLNEKQYSFYAKYINANKLIKTSSYISIKDEDISCSKHTESLISDIRYKYDYVFCCSGFPSEIYRHDWSIEAVLNKSNAAIIVCLYGKGDMYKLQQKFSSYENVFFFYYLSQDDFNFILKNADCYLRPNSVDSFGVAVADAISFGTTVIASNICPRYKGTVLFNSESKKDFFNLIKSYPFKDKFSLKISNEDIMDFNLIKTIRN